MSDNLTSFRDLPAGHALPIPATADDIVAWVQHLRETRDYIHTTFSGEEAQALGKYTAVGLAADLKVFVDKCQNESLYTALCKSPMGSQNNSFQHEWPSHLKAVNGNGEPSTPVALFERSSLCLEALGKRDEELRAEAERLHAIEEHAREILSDPNIPDRERSLIGMILWQDGHRKDECRYENGCPLRHGR